MSNYIQFQISPAAIAEAARLQITTAHISSLMFAPLLAALTLSVPFGIVVDRFGPKATMASAFAITFLASAARAACTCYAGMLIASVLMGIGPTALNANIVKILGTRFGTRTDFSLGWYYASSSAGMAASLATTNLFPSVQCAYLIASATLLPLIAAWPLLTGKAPAVHSAVGDAASNSRRSAAGLVGTMRIGQVWVISVILGIGMAASEAYIGYFPAVLGNHMDSVTAGSLASMLAIGSIAGAIISPMFRAKAHSYRTYMLAVSAIGAFLMLATCRLAATPSAAMIFPTGAFCAACGPIVQGLLYQLPEIDPGNAGTAGGFVSMASLGLTYCLPICIAHATGGDCVAILYAATALYALSMPLIAILPKPDALKA